MAEYIDIDDKVVVTDTRGRERRTTVRHILGMNKGVYTAADVVERKHGKWERHNDGIMYWWDCSECHHDAYYDGDDLYNFCPNCGADMRDETDEERRKGE